MRSTSSPPPPPDRRLASCGGRLGRTGVDPPLGRDHQCGVVGALFDEADRRDPTHDRDWVALVDGNNHQIDRISTEATARGVKITIVVDFIHVLEYVWKAAWSFHREGDPAAELWVRRHAQQILAGHATRVAGPEATYGGSERSLYAPKEPPRHL